MTLCSVCGRRRAQYYQSSSGHRLCSVCLERFLLRRMKRTLSMIGVFKPRPRILYITLCGFLLESLALFNIFYKLERRYDASIDLYTPDFTKDYFRNRYPLLDSIIAYKCPKYIDDVIDYFEEIIESTSIIEGYDVYVLPLTRNHVLSIQLIMAGRDRLKLYYTKPYFIYNNRVYAYPCYHIGLSDAVAYAYFKKLLDQELLVKDTMLGDKLYSRVCVFTLMLWRNYSELLYSSIDGFEYLIEYLDLEGYVETSKNATHTPSKNHQI